MVIDLVAFGVILLLIRPANVVLSVWIAVFVCGWPSSSSVFLRRLLVCIDEKLPPRMT